MLHVRLFCGAGMSTSWQAGGTGEMILSVTAGCILEIILVIKCGSWARDVLGG